MSQITKKDNILVNYLNEQYNQIINRYDEIEQFLQDAEKETEKYLH